MKISLLSITLLILVSTSCTRFYMIQEDRRIEEYIQPKLDSWEYLDLRGTNGPQEQGENNVYYVCRKAELGGDCSYLSIHYKELEARVLARVPDLFGYEDEAPIQNASEIERIRCLIHEKTVSERNLVKAIQTKDALVSVLAHELATRTKELEELHRELDLAMGVDQRNKTSKQTMEELQKNIQQILHGKFNGIFDGKEEDRLKLKAYLSQVIKRIEITTLS